MITIIDVLESLNVKKWTLRGDALTEAEFNEGFTQNGSKNPNDWSITWSEVLAKKTELQAAEPMRILRLERTRLLAQSDWMANSDVTMTTEWQTYRQALRDITTQTPALDENGNLTGITWPLPPTD